MKKDITSGKGTETRLLKVYERIAARTTRDAWQRQHYISLPEIRLQGRWLEASGFNSGQTIKVAYEHNRIVITTGEE